MYDVASEKDPIEQFTDDQNCDSLSSSLLADLEARVQQLTEEKANLAAQLEGKLNEHRQQREAYVSRYVNADYLLALFGSKLVAKRLQTADSGACSRRQQQQQLLNGSEPTEARVDVLQACRQLLDPATNLVYQRMHEATKEAYTRVRQSHDDLLAWKFTPESASGRKLMSHVRQLLAANQQLGQVNHADRISQLESEVDLEAKCIKEFVDTHQGINLVLSEAYTDLEGLQSSLLILHQQINQAEAVVEELQNALEARQPGRVSQLMEAVVAELAVSDTVQSVDDNAFAGDGCCPAEQLGNPEATSPNAGESGLTEDGVVS